MYTVGTYCVFFHPRTHTYTHLVLVDATEEWGWEKKDDFGEGEWHANDDDDFVDSDGK